jgi:hypothetical protein
MKSIHTNFIEQYHNIRYSDGGINIRRKIFTLNRGERSLISIHRVRNQLELYFVNNNWISRKFMISNH